MKFDCSLETRTSKKGNTTYTCLVVKLPENVEKIIFLNPAELALINSHLTTKVQEVSEILD